MKRLLKLVIGLVVLLIVGLVVVGIYADDLAKAGIEKAGSKALGVATTADDVDVGFFSGTVSLDDLAVANPEGYPATNFFELGNGAVEVSLSSLMDDVVAVPQLTLTGPRIRLIQDLKRSNYGTILENLAAFQGTSKDDSEGKRFIIEKLVIEDTVVSVLPVKQLNLGEVKIPIEKIELNDVGTESDKGVLLSELAGILIESILKRASATGKLPGLVQGTLDGRLTSLTGLKQACADALDGLALPGGGTPETDALKEKALDKLKGIGFGK